MEQFAHALADFVRAHQTWAAPIVFLLAYWAAFIANIAFDVYLEGPVGGIWFWCLFGIGMAAVRIHRDAPHVLPDLAAPARPSVSAPPPPHPFPVRRPVGLLPPA